MPRTRPVEVPEGQEHDPWRRAAFVEWMRIRNFSNITVKGYRGSVKQFIAFCEERSIDGPEEVTRTHVQRFQRWLYYYRIPASAKRPERPLTYETQLYKLTSVRSYFQFFVRRGWLGMNPATDLDLPKQGKKLPKVILKIDEVSRLFAACDSDTWKGVRDRAILEMFYSTGIRRAELANLRVGDMDLDGCTAMVRQGKGKKDRVVPVGDRAIHWAAKYLLEVRPKQLRSKDPGNLFLTQKGTEISPETLTAMVGQYLDKAGLHDIQGGPHMFRHAMATHMLNNGADIRHLQEMLGHAFLHTTQRYTRVSIRKLQEVHARTHPARYSRDFPDEANIDMDADKAALLAAIEAEDD